MTDQDDVRHPRPATPAESNVAMPSRIATAATTIPIASAAPDASPRRRSRSTTGVESEVVEDDPVSGFGRPVAGDQPRAERRLEGARD